MTDAETEAMDGRRIALFAALTIVGVGGCKSKQTQTSNMAVPPAMAGNASNMIERALAPKPPGPHNISQPVEVAAKPNATLKPETVATFAELEVDSTFNNEELTASERDRRLDAARQKFQKALQTDPKNLEALRGLARLYTRLGDKDRAAQTYQTAMQHHPKNHALAHDAALSCGRFEEWERAAALWQIALSLDPENRKYPRLIGLAYARLGKYEDGFNAMLKVMPEADARLVMARELMETGRADLSRQQVELALKADPNCEAAAAALQQMNGGGIQQTGYRQ